MSQPSVSQLEFIHRRRQLMAALQDQRFQEAYELAVGLTADGDQDGQAAYLAGAAAMALGRLKDAFTWFSEARKGKAVSELQLERALGQALYMAGKEKEGALLMLKALDRMGLGLFGISPVAFNTCFPIHRLQHRPVMNVYAQRFPEMAEFEKDWVWNNPPNGDDMTRLYFLAENLKRLVEDGVPGDLAELGVYKGNSARIIHRIAPERRLFLFDTFNGFPDRDLEPGDHRTDVFHDTSLEAVQDFVGRHDNLIYRPGYFPDTLDGMDEEAVFAFVHLDCDVYAPMKAALDYFYPRISPGGMLAIHDFSNPHWPGVARAVAECRCQWKESLVVIPDRAGTAVLIKA
ncbi:MAG: TylF/MycF/NovP-related O-methyltransferase [Rhodospirillales bacterium]